jgi:uncharacterized protein
MDKSKINYKFGNMYLVPDFLFKHPQPSLYLYIAIESSVKPNSHSPSIGSKFAKSNDKNQKIQIMSNYHEPAGELSEETREFIRALMSLKEEIEAVDWYQQRFDASSNEDLKRLLAHNRDEEIEHACMTLEWLRRNMPGWDKELRKSLFKDDEISYNEDQEKEDKGEQSGDLQIGTLK